MKGRIMKIIVGITGASGVEMAYTLLKELRRVNCEIHLIISDGAKLTWTLESNIAIEKLYRYADKIYDNKDFAAKIASGSFETDGMIILPCSMKTLAGLVTGYSDNLVLRAADVCIKENRKVVICPREMPFSKLHIDNLQKASQLNCTIIAPLLSFYNHADTIQKQINHIVGKILMQFHIKMLEFVPWEGNENEKH